MAVRLILSTDRMWREGNEEDFRRQTVKLKVYVQAHTLKSAHVCTYTQECTCTHTHSRGHICTYTQECTCTHIHSRVHMHIHTVKSAHAHTYTQECTCMHTLYSAHVDIDSRVGTSANTL